MQRVDRRSGQRVLLGTQTLRERPGLSAYSQVLFEKKWRKKDLVLVMLKPWPSLGLSFPRRRKLLGWKP